MKHLIITFFCITFFSLGYSFAAYLEPQGQDEGEPSIEEEYIRYNSPDKRFSIHFPEEWDSTFQEKESSLAAVSPPDDAYDTFRENILVDSFQLSVVADLKDYFSGNLEFLTSKIPNIKILKTEKLKIDDQQAIKLSYTSEMGGYHYYTIQVFMLKDRRGYIMTFMAEKKRLEDYRDIFHQIIESFQFESH